MNWILLTLLVVTCFQSYSANDADLDSILENIFGQQNTPEPAKPEKSDVDSLIESIFGPEDDDTPLRVTSSPVGSKTNEPCSLNGKEGVCVAYYLCKRDKLKNESLIDLLLEDTQCESYLDVCCLKSK